jgi:hypothetical protein
MKSNNWPYLPKNHGDGAVCGATSTFVYRYVCVPVRLCTGTFAGTFVYRYVCVPVRLCTGTFMYRYVCVPVHLCTGRYVCVPVCLCTRMFVYLSSLMTEYSIFVWVVHPWNTFVLVIGKFYAFNSSGSIDGGSVAVRWWQCCSEQYNLNTC